MSIKRFNPTCAAVGFGVKQRSLARHTRVNLGVSCSRQLRTPITRIRYTCRSPKTHSHTEQFKF
jgi:hypothetical protein